MNEHAFDALCSLAAQEKWCWNIVCTTCGHMHFRFALLDLSDGIHPSSQRWRVHRNKHNGYGDLPTGLGSSAQRRLAQILAGASIKKIVGKAPFPNWLGYLGLGLLYTEDHERESRQLTVTWTPQLISLLPTSAEARARLQAILTNHSEVLTWRHLESVEYGLRFVHELRMPPNK